MRKIVFYIMTETITLFASLWYFHTKANTCKFIKQNSQRCKYPIKHKKMIYLIDYDYDNW